MATIASRPEMRPAFGQRQRRSNRRAAHVHDRLVVGVVELERLSERGVRKRGGATRTPSRRCRKSVMGPAAIAPARRRESSGRTAVSDPASARPMTSSTRSFVAATTSSGRSSNVSLDTHAASCVASGPSTVFREKLLGVSWSAGEPCRLPRGPHKSGHASSGRNGPALWRMSKLRCAILDDYQHVALSCGGLDAGWPIAWTSVRCIDTSADEAELASLIGDCEIVVVMRERTPFTRSLFARLPKSEAAGHERDAERGNRSGGGARARRHRLRHRQPSGTAGGADVGADPWPRPTRRAGVGGVPRERPVAKHRRQRSARTDARPARPGQHRRPRGARRTSPSTCACWRGART